MHSSLILASLLPFLASAKPILSRQSTVSPPFGLVAARSASPIHLQTINANGQRFWIGKNASTYCPSDVVTDCPPGTSTEIVAADGTASMNVAVPGGQQVFVLPTGQLSYTQPHSADTHNGSLTTFTYTPPSSDSNIGSFSFTGNGATGFLACPDKETAGAPWMVFANVEGLSDDDVPGGEVGACLGFGALTAVGAGGAAAWEYV